MRKSKIVTDLITEIQAKDIEINRLKKIITDKALGSMDKTETGIKMQAIQDMQSKQYLHYRLQEASDLVTWIDRKEIEEYQQNEPTSWGIEEL